MITYPLLVGLDGARRCRSRRGNYIGITEPPEEMFGKVDVDPGRACSPQWWALVLGGEHPDGEPMEWKLELARASPRRWHGEEARRAEAHFTRVVREGGAPEEVPEHPLPDGDPVHLPAVIAAAFGLSTSEARRMIAQGGVKLDGEPVRSSTSPRGRLGKVLQAGKRRFARLADPAA